MNKRVTVPRSELFLRKKNDAANCSPEQRPAIVWAMADLPAPAGPFNHMIDCRACGFLTQSVIVFKTFSRVWGWHLGGGKRAWES